MATITGKYAVLPEIMRMLFQLNQVFMNLMVNAVPAIKERGTITLCTACAIGSVFRVTLPVSHATDLKGA